MSDDSIVTLILGVAVMFLGTGITPLLAGKRGQRFSIVLGICFLAAAWGWPTIKTHIGPELHASLLAAASNAYVWLALLGFTWVYLAVSNLIQELILAKPSLEKKISASPSPIAVHERRDTPPPKAPLPESFQPDAELLTKRLNRDPEWSKFRVQILFGNSEKCARLGREFSQILKNAHWEEASPPTLISPDTKMPKGVSLRSSHGDPSSAAAKLWLAFREVGIDVDSQELPELRTYDHCFLYFVE